MYNIYIIIYNIIIYSEANLLAFKVDFYSKACEIAKIFLFFILIESNYIIHYYSGKGYNLTTKFKEEHKLSPFSYSYSLQCIYKTTSANQVNVVMLGLHL